jgi:hypothetical protein
MSTCSLSGNTLSSTGDLNINSTGNINLQNGTTTYGTIATMVSGSTNYLYIQAPPNDQLFIGSPDNFILGIGGTGFSTQANSISMYQTGGAEMYIDASNIPLFLKSTASLNLNSGTINLQNIQNNGTTYGSILNDNSGLHIKNNNNYILIDSTNNPIFLYTGSTSSTGLVLQTGPFDTYGSFTTDSNLDLTIASGTTGTNNLTLSAVGQITLSSNSSGAINLKNNGTTYGSILNDNSGLHIKNNNNYILIDSTNYPIFLYTGSTSSTGLILQTGPFDTYGSFTTDSKGSLTIQSGYDSTGNNNFTLDASGQFFLNNSSSGAINLKNNGTTYGSILNDNSGLHIKNNNNYILIDSTNYSIFLYTGSTSSTGLILQTGPFDTYGSFSSNGGNLTISSSSLNGGNINFGTYGYVNSSNGFTISSASGNDLNLISPGNKICLCNNITDSSSDTTICINTPNGSNVNGQYCTINTTSQGNNLEINTPGSAGTIALNASSGVTTNYVAGFNPTGTGIINQTALAQMFESGNATMSISSNNNMTCLVPTFITPSHVFISLLGNYNYENIVISTSISNNIFYINVWTGNIHTNVIVVNWLAISF